MAKRGQRPTVLDPEEGFIWWYNDGQRRTYGQVSSHFGVHYNTVRKCADEHDWDGRADELDRKAREIVDARLASMRAQATIRLAEIGMAVIVRFSQRLPEKVRDASGAIVDNPDMLRPGELTTMDLLRAAQVLKETGLIGVEGEQAVDEQLQALEELRAEVRGMYEREQLELEAAEVVEVVEVAAPAKPAVKRPSKKSVSKKSKSAPPDAGGTVAGEAAGQGGTT